MRYRLIVLLFINFSFCSWSNKSIGLADQYMQDSNFEAALTIYTQEINQFNNQKKNDTLIAEIYLKRGKVYQFTQKYGLAFIDFKTAESIYKNKNNISGLINCYVRFGDYYRNKGEYKKSYGYFNNAHTLIENNVTSDLILANYYNRFAALIGQTSGDLKLILEYSNKAIEFSKKGSNKNIEASSYNEIAYAYENNKSPLSEDYFLKSLNLYHEINSPRNEVTVIANLARLYLDSGKNKLSITYCDKGLNLIKTTNWFNIKNELFLVKYRNFFTQGKFKKAIIMLDSANLNAMKDREVQWNKTIKEVETKFEVEKKDKQIQLEKSKLLLLKEESKQRQKEVNLYILISILLFSILIVALFSYLKIKNSNKKLNQSMEQKEVLLQEVHHRVKNNLTLLNSLLYLRAKASKDEDVKLILNECQSRVLSMSIVHQNLYDVDDTSKVDFQNFIEELLFESTSLFNKKEFEIKTKIDTSKLTLDMAMAIFLGLILNELITNSFKYAFHKNSNNEINIKFYLEKGFHFLMYKDSGPGLKNNKIDETSGFGFKLIKIMLDQIDGTLNYDIDTNTFLIKFK